AARIEALMDRIRTAGHPFRDFKTAEELGAQVHADLLAMLDRYWPESSAPTPLDLERRAQAAFASSRIRAYIPNPEHLKAFTAWMSEGSAPLVITGESGLGKSSLVAYLVDYVEKKNPSA